MYRIEIEENRSARRDKWHGMAIRDRNNHCFSHAFGDSRDEVIKKLIEKFEKKQARATEEMERANHMLALLEDM